MLKHLSVRNYALIDELDLEFRNGLTVLTGETGAGKSIILGALGLVLGKRADLKALRNPDQKCVVEAIFNLDGQRFSNFFDQNDLDFEVDCIIRREISPSGKSRTFINDTPVTLNVLNQLSSQVVDVHSQQDTLLLNNTAFQLQLLDSYAQNLSQKTVYTEAYKNWGAAAKAISHFEQAFSMESFDLDYQQFLFDELEEAKLEVGEQVRLEEELRILENAGEIRESLSAAVDSFDNGGGEGITPGLNILVAALRRLASFGDEYGELLIRVQSSLIELEDIRQELDTLTEGAEIDPSKLGTTDERLSLLLRLQKKHATNSEDELIAKKEQLGLKLEQYANHDEGLQKLKQEFQQAEDRLAKVSHKLTASRVAAIPKVESGVQKLLEDLNMPAAKFEVKLSLAPFQPSGSDAIDFYFSANPGQASQPLGKVASGGELSRVMLAVKAIMAAKNELPTIIFDEIDTGVSGETAGKIGSILKEMSRSMQVLAITHLPQIASRGEVHLKVFKQIQANITRSSIEILHEDARLQELARMLSGEQITEAAIANARTLLHN